MMTQTDDIQLTTATLDTSKLKEIGRKLFGIEEECNTDFSYYLKNNSQFLNLNLPDNINEPFISSKYAPAFWIIKSPLFSRIDEFIRFKLVNSPKKTDYNNVLRSFQKWIQNKIPEEKTYFANTTINFLLKDYNKHNFFYEILHAIILIYDDKLRNIPKAYRLLLNSKDAIELLKLSPKIKRELDYYLKIYIGFCKLKQNDYSGAIDSFNKALSDKPFGVNAKYYLAWCYAVTGEQQSALLILKELYNYDIHRLTYTIKNSDKNAFNYFIENAIIYNVFSDEEFACLAIELEIFFKQNNKIDENIQALKDLKEGLERFSKLYHLYDYFTEENINNFSFLGNTIENSLKSDNYLFLSIAKKLNDKFLENVQAIINEIKQKYFNQNSEKLEYYDKEIRKNEEKLNRLRKELDEFKEQIKKTSEEMTKAIENKRNSDITLMETAVKKFNEENERLYKNSFSNSIFYAFVLTIFVFILGCLTSYSSAVSDSQNYIRLFLAIIYGGLKWGSVAFIIGFIFAVISLLNTKLNRTNRSKILNSRLNELKKMKTKELSIIEEDAIRKKQSLDKNYKRRLEDTQIRIEILISERAKPEALIKEEAENFIKKEAGELLEVIK